MKKKLKDLTDEELDSICKKYHDCTENAAKSTVLFGMPLSA